MKADFFIDRPVFSAVISIVIVIVGFIGLTMLPIDQYPQITPPTVKVSASYPGASALTVSQAVATPIEQELNGTPGMLYMESSSTNTGSFSATVTFDISVNPDLAAVEIQNRVKQAEARLPAEVVQNGISVEKQASNQLMTVCLLSSDDKFDEIYLSNFATLNVVDILRRIPGVGGVSNVGSRYYAMQIWVQPDKLASFGVTVQDLQSALKDQNRESAAGVLGQQPIEGVDISIPISTQGRLSSVEEFENIVVRANPNGSIIRLKDVARVSLEAQSYNTESGLNGGNAAVMNIRLLPGANAMEVSKLVRESMKEISASFPEGISYLIPFDITTYISESIHEVYKALFEALFLVILIVFLSLQSWRATLIPIIAVPHLADRYFRSDADIRLLAQHAHPAGPHPRHRYRGGRRHRSGGKRHTHHGGEENRSLRSDERGHARHQRSADYHLARTLRGIRPREFPFGHHRHALPPVHRHHRSVGTHLHRRGPHVESGHVRPAAQAG